MEMLSERAQRILLIGGTRGTGLLIARLLLQRGYRVRAVARDPVKGAAALGSDVEVVAGDVTKLATLPRATQDADHVIFTAGVRTGLRREQTILATEYRGVVNTLDAVRVTGFNGRFIYMTSIGVTRRSLTAVLLNLTKGNTLRWRARAEDAIRRSGVNYTIVRAGILLDAPSGRRAIELHRQALPLEPKYRIARADAAETIVEALQRPDTMRRTLDVVWGKGANREPWDALFARLKPGP